MSKATASCHGLWIEPPNTSRMEPGAGTIRDSCTSANAMLIPIKVVGTSSARTLAARGKWRFATSPARRNNAMARPARRPRAHHRDRLPDQRLRIVTL